MKLLILVLFSIVMTACAKGEEGSPVYNTSPPSQTGAPTVPANTPSHIPVCGEVLTCGLYCANTYPDRSGSGFNYCMDLPANNVPGYNYTP